MITNKNIAAGKGKARLDQYQTRTNRNHGRETLIGRPETYSPAIGAKICHALAEGMTMTKICKLPGAPKQSTVRQWIWQNLDSAFTAAYARAREIAAHEAFDSLQDLEEDVLAGRRHANDVRCVMDCRRWRLAKLLPAIYGDRSQVILGGEVAVTERPSTHAPTWIPVHPFAIRA